MYHLDVQRLFAAAGREIGVASALLIVALGALGFVGIADEVVEGETHALDLAVLQALRVDGRPDALIGPEWLHVAAVDITALGSVAVLTLLILAGFALLGSLRRWTEAWLLALGALSGVTVSQGLKALFGRERPDEAYRVVEAVNASFPSGHAMLSAVVFLTLGVLASRFAERRRVKILAISAAVLVSLLVGASRVYLGVHWTSDVLAGWSVGAAWAMICWLVAYLVERRFKPTSASDAT